MQRILTELDRSHEVKQGHQEVRGFSVAFTARERLQPSLRTALFAGNPLMHAQILANIRAMREVKDKWTASRKRAFLALMTGMSGRADSEYPSFDGMRL
jgi:hypothetical protein